ncbi:hypothetical protein LMG28688_01627 [Paraburkholderia caffeinitolerans]|uniref:Phage tail collar domain-containing protein n=1 Tax=Paraburkholderia caffeinitolerans TaxID=1723730 RepID=A0A6J5FN81_9BURK|nr:hypothetical protein [Paraburkholderia caffeinitolerans]CAB3783339.1 hypothetical protein LMG28688_01627 [Paraburkholderia caffeinitolerans]
MDRLIASNSVPMAQADTAPLTGTPQGATDGNPATNIPATRWPSYQYNAIQEELIAILTAAGITPNRTNNAQIAGAIQSLIQGGKTNVGADTGAANAYVVAFTPALSAPIPWAPFWFKVKTTNTGASTLNASGTAYAMVGAAHAALQGGELVANGDALVYWNPTLASGSGSFVLLLCSGAAEQIAPATQSQHAVQLGQMQAAGPSVGATDVAAYIASAASSVTFTASQVVMGVSVSGAKQIVGNISRTINIATVGANGMDTGASPASTSIAVYAIYNPTTSTTALLGQQIGSVPTPTYGGANMPSGYTYSALLGVYITNPSGQFVAFKQINRKIWVTRAGIFGTTSSGGTTWHQTSFSGIAPWGAKAISGDANAVATAAGSIVFNLGVGGDANGIGNQTSNTTYPSGCGPSLQYADIPLDSNLNAYLYYNCPTGSPTAQSYNFFASAYTF